MRAQKASKALAALASLVFLFFLFSKKEVKSYSGMDFVMSTFATQQIFSDGGKKASTEVVNGAFTMLKSYENRYSLYHMNSEISEINDNAGAEFTEVSEELFLLLKKSVEYSQISEGTFDVTIAPITIAWGINSDAPRVPSVEELDELVKLVDYREIQFDDENMAVKLGKEGMKLDLGAIAKGYVCLPVKDFYESKGVVGAILSIGGNIMLYGENPDDSEGFTVGIKAPQKDQKALLGTVTLTNMVIASSGGYERYFEDETGVYEHIFNPNTGHSIDSDFKGVTIITENGAYADYLSTYIYGIPLERMIEIKENNENTDYEFIAVDKENNVYVSSGLLENFEPTQDSEFKFVDYEK